MSDDSQFFMFNQFRFLADTFQDVSCLCKDCGALCELTSRATMEDALEWAWNHIEECGK